MLEPNLIENYSIVPDCWIKRLDIVKQNLLPFYLSRTSVLIHSVVRVESRSWKFPAESDAQSDYFQIAY